MAYNLEEQESIDNLKGWWEKWGTPVLVVITLACVGVAGCGLLRETRRAAEGAAGCGVRQAQGNRPQPLTYGTPLAPACRAPVEAD